MVKLGFDLCFDLCDLWPLTLTFCTDLTLVIGNNSWKFQKKKNLKISWWYDEGNIIPGTLGPCFHYWCSVYGICKWSDTLWPVGCACLFADYIISLSSLCRLIWRHWTTKMLVKYMLPSVCLRLRQFSQLSFIQYMGLCVFSLPNSPVMITRMCTLSYYHHQTGSMNH